MGVVAQGRKLTVGASGEILQITCLTFQVNQYRNISLVFCSRLFSTKIWKVLHTVSTHPGFSVIHPNFMFRFVLNKKPHYSHPQLK